jgi:hypothetical protein
MPSDFPGSAKALKGALVVYEQQFLGKVPGVIVFQYNPDSLRHTLSSRAAVPDEKSPGALKEDVLRTMGAPVESFNLTIELDAADQLDEPSIHPAAVRLGIHPALAALELLLYPPQEGGLWQTATTSSDIVQTSKEGQTVPLVLFVWGRRRVLPVQVSSFSVTEQAFDENLNPIRASVELQLQVLTDAHLVKDSIGYGAYRATLRQKEVMAALNLANSAEQALGIPPAQLADAMTPF